MQRLMNRIIFLSKIWEEHFTNYAYFSQITSLKAPTTDLFELIRTVLIQNQSENKSG